MNDVVSRYKWVGTRPIRPDGVPKVTGVPVAVRHGDLVGFGLVILTFWKPS